MNEYRLSVHIEQLENGEFLATAGDLPGLVAQGRTIRETLEIAQDVARRILESYKDHGDPLPEKLRPVGKAFDIDLAVYI